MNFLKDLPELIKADVISIETADKIRSYYKSKEQQSSNKLLISFGILGSLLIGLGIILIIAHNWDDLSNNLKTICAFFPLLIGQIVAIYVFIKQRESIAWREASAVFLFIAVAVCISLISQIYNIPGSIASFMLTWLLLTIPLVYTLRSSLVSLFVIVGISYYHIYNNYWAHITPSDYWYFAFILLVIPHYIQLLKENKWNGFIAFHHWLLSISILIAIPVFIKTNEQLIVIAYASTLASLYIVGSLINFENKKWISNGYKIVAAILSMSLCYMLSFKSFWYDITKATYDFHELQDYCEVIIGTVSTFIAIILLIIKVRNKSIREIQALDVLFLFILPIYFIGHFTTLAQVLMNLLIFFNGLYTIWQGHQKNHLGIINYGLLIISILIICRFFDSNLNFIVRGLLFVLVGIGFLATNLFIIKKRKSNES